MKAASTRAGEAPRDVVFAFLAAFAVGLVAFTSTQVLSLHRTINVHLPCGGRPSLPGVRAGSVAVCCCVSPCHQHPVAFVSLPEHKAAVHGEILTSNIVGRWRSQK